MTRITARFGILAVVLFTAIAALPQQSWLNSSQKAIADLEEHWLQHVDDPAVLQSILADDFVHVLPSGFITKQQQIEYAKAHPRSPQETRHFDNLTVRVYGDTGIADGIVSISNAAGTNKTLFTDVFVKRNGQWQAVNAQETPQQPEH
jgi:Domain of unknown function (DUF4440)